MPAVTRNGATLSYACRGSGPVVLMLQGVGVAGSGWGPQADVLSRRFTVVTTDNRGIGASTRGSGALSIESMADDALAILDATGIGTCHVVGHSMGGLIALQVASTAPHRVNSLALLCTFPRGRDASRLRIETLIPALRTRVGTRAMRRQAFLELVMPRSVLDSCDRTTLAANLALLFGHDLADQPSIVMKQLRAMGRYDATPRLTSMRHVPTLVVSAAQDRIAPTRFGRALAAAIPGSRYVEIDDAAHGVTIQRADDISSLLMEHIDDAENWQRERERRATERAGWTGAVRAS